jgi:hypothetical protein
MERLIFLLFLSLQANAYEVNIYDSSDPKKAVVEVVDDCNYSHKLVVDKNKLNNNKVLHWIDILFDENYYCQKNNVKTVDN